MRPHSQIKVAVIRTRPASIPGTRARVPLNGPTSRPSRTSRAQHAPGPDVFQLHAGAEEVK